MTIIKSMKLKGFKSFANPTEIPFGPYFNIILGPNGSGKSNIMDALCFVLGKRSAKSMRAEKSANLIFNGGKKGSAMNKAEVSIVFDNSNKDFKIDSKEVKITRIVKQNGSSDYRINDEKRTREQVIELLAHANIDPDGHNVVLQGDIVRFMDMRPDDRRELLEEVAGISVYEDRKVKAMNELGRVEERLKEARLILTERGAYLRELKKERDQALKFKDCENKIKENKATYLHLQIKQKNESKDKVESSVNKSNKEIESLGKNINELKEKIDNNRKTIEDLNKNIEQKGEKEQINLQRNIESLREEIIRDSARMEAVESEIIKIHDRKKRLLLDLDELDIKVNSLISTNSKLVREIEDNIKEEKELLKKISGSKKGYSLNDLKKIERIEDQIENNQQKILNLQERKQFLLRDKDKFKFELEKINSIFDLLDKKKIKDKISDLKKIEKELENVYSKDVVLGNRLSKLRTDFSVKNQELMKLRIKQETSKEFSLGNLAVKKVLGKKGVYGTISSLGEVDENYSNALEVVAGGRLNAIIVKDDKTAVDCIKELKKNKIGRAIFLPLNKISKKHISGLRELKNKKGVVGSALELIKYDKKYENAFSYVFGSSLIVDDVDVARRVGVGKCRMITLDGDLFESTGVISGGYRRKSFGKFLEKNLDNNVSKLSNEIKLIKSDLDELERERKLNEGNLIKSRENKFVLEGEIIKFESSSGVKDIKKLKGDKDKVEDSLKQIDLDLKNFDGLIGKLNNGIEIFRDDKNKLRGKKIDDSKVEEISNLEIQQQKMRESIVRNESEIKNIDNQIKGIHDPEREKINQIIKDHEKEIKDFEQELLNLRDFLKVKNKELNERKIKESKFMKEYKSLFSKKNKLNEDVNKFESRISSEEFKINEIEKRINDYHIRKAKVIAELEALNEEYEEFKDVKIKRNINLDDLRAEIKRFEHMMKNMGNVNLRALEIYDNVEKEFNELVGKAEILKQEKEDVLGMMHEIEKNKHGVFMKTFKIIAENFKNIFLSLSTKGEAVMDLEDKENPFSAGIDIRVKLVGNKYLDIKSLSGGEKTLAALSFIFAIQEFNPANFYLLDEVDAALDKTNSELLSKLVAKYSSKSQYIMISHNDQIITEADKLYGISMQQNGISKITSLEF